MCLYEAIQYDPFVPIQVNLQSNQSPGQVTVLWDEQKLTNLSLNLAQMDVHIFNNQTCICNLIIYCFLLVCCITHSSLMVLMTLFS